MERALGADLSAVRIHQDERALRLGASAFTQGAHISFAPGEYSPHTTRGQRILGHELAHVVQQGAGRVRGGGIVHDSGLEVEAERAGEHASREELLGGGRREQVPTLSRSSGLEAGNPDLAGSSAESQPVQRKVKMPPNTNLPSFHDMLTKDGDIYSYDTPFRNSGLSVEVFSSLFHSPRIFELKGSDGRQAEYFLMRHMEARRGVVAFAKQKQYKFEGGRENFQMNPEYWELDRSRGKFWKKEDVDWQEARDDVNKNPEKYAIGCAAAAKITMEGGGRSKRAFDETNDDKDWIPGDGGFIENRSWKPGQAGLEGENIIYMGGKQFWGHYSNENSIQPYTKWLEEVEGWDGDDENGSAKLTKDREWPSKGLQ